MPKRRRPSRHASPDAPAPSRPQRANPDQAAAANSALAILALGFAGHTTAAQAVAGAVGGITITVNVRRR